MKASTFKAYAGWSIEAQWYENIPEHGVLCWVSDSYSLPKKVIGIVTEYTPKEAHKFTTTCTFFKYAVPVTKEEVEKYYAI